MTDRTYQREVLAYFSEKAPLYDKVSEQVYWRLSDDLIWEALQRFVLNDVPRGARLLDAGGGTGRWTDRILRHRPDMSALIYDLSRDMTKEAAAKACHDGYDARLDIVNGDLADLLEHVEPEAFDLVLSFHNVLGFVDKVPQVLSNFVTGLRHGGRMMLVAPNAYHCAYFQITLGDAEAAVNSITKHVGRYTPEMPQIRLFTPASLRQLVVDAGGDVQIVTGAPVLIYPGQTETRISGNSDYVLAEIGSTDAYQRIFDAESELLGVEEIAARGNNLILVAGRT